MTPLNSRKVSGLPHRLYLLVDEEGDEFHCLECNQGTMVNWTPYPRSVTGVLADTFMDDLEERVGRELERKRRSHF